MFRTYGLQQWYHEVSKKEARHHAFCENYRPISLPSIRFQVFAKTLLPSAGAYTRVWPTQFGFRAGQGRAHALFVVSPLLEQMCVAKHGSLAFLPADRATAFDGISPDNLIVALRRFSLQTNFCSVMDKYMLVASVWCEMVAFADTKPTNVAHLKDVHCHLSCFHS